MRKMRKAFVALVSLCTGLSFGFIVPAGVPELLDKNTALLADNYAKKINATKQSVNVLLNGKNRKDEKELYEHVTEKESNVNERSYVFLNQVYKANNQNKLYSSHLHGYYPPLGSKDDNTLAYQPEPEQEPPLQQKQEIMFFKPNLNEDIPKVSDISGSFVPHKHGCNEDENIKSFYDGVNYNDKSKPFIYMHRQAEKSGSKYIEHPVYKEIEQTANKRMEQISHNMEQTPNRAMVKTAKKGMQLNSFKGMELNSNRGVEQNSKRGKEKTADRSMEQIANRGIDTNANRGMDATAYRAMDPFANRARDPNSNRAIDPNTSRGMVPMANRGMEKMSYKGIEQTASIGKEQTAYKSMGQTVTKQDFAVGPSLSTPKQKPLELRDQDYIVVFKTPQPRPMNYIDRNINNAIISKNRQQITKDYRKKHYKKPNIKNSIRPSEKMKAEFGFSELISNTFMGKETNNRIYDGNMNSDAHNSVNLANKLDAQEMEQVLDYSDEDRIIKYVKDALAEKNMAVTMYPNPKNCNDRECLKTSTGFQYYKTHNNNHISHQQIPKCNCVLYNKVKQRDSPDNDYTTYLPDVMKTEDTYLTL